MACHQAPHLPFAGDFPVFGLPDITIAFIFRPTGPSPVTVETDTESKFRDITDPPSTYAIIFSIRFPSIRRPIVFHPIVTRRVCVFPPTTPPFLCRQRRGRTIQGYQNPGYVESMGRFWGLCHGTTVAQFKGKRTIPWNSLSFKR
jgi:hypothetical protein